MVLARLRTERRRKATVLVDKCDTRHFLSFLDGGRSLETETERGKKEKTNDEAEI